MTERRIWTFAAKMLTAFHITYVLPGRLNK